MKNKLAPYFRYCIICSKWMNSKVRIYNNAFNVKNYECKKCGIFVERTVEVYYEHIKVNKIEVEFSYKRLSNSSFDIQNETKHDNYYVYNSFSYEEICSAKDFNSAYLVVKRLIKNKDLF